MTKWTVLNRSVLTFPTVRDTRRELRTQKERFYRRKPVYVRRVDLDEQTRRFLVAAGYSTRSEEVRIDLADLQE